MDEDNRFRFSLWQDGWQSVGSGVIPQPGHWYHLAVTVDNGAARLYVNGILEDEATLDLSIPETVAPLTMEDSMNTQYKMTGLTNCTILLVLILTNSTTVGQPTPAELADRLEQVTMERIQQIDRLQITNRFTAGMLEGQETTSIFEKVERDGRYVLEPVETDDMYETGEMAGHAEDLYSEMIRHASSIEHDSYNGSSVYRIFVDDIDFLNQIGAPDALLDDQIDEIDDEPVPESLTFLLDRDDLVMLFGSYTFTGPDGGEFKMNITLSEYENFSGLPIPMVTEIEVEGIGQMFTDEDIAEAREAMREMEAQLAEMPEVQRKMIEAQIRPQMEQYEALLESGEIGHARIEVIDVVVN